MIDSWATSWCVTFNASKTEDMIISMKRTQRSLGRTSGKSSPFSPLHDVMWCQPDQANHPPIFFMNNKLSPSNNITLLGISIANTLSWAQHITGIAKKTAKRLYILGWYGDLLTQQARITIFKAYMYTALWWKYAALVWSGAGTTSLALLDRL